ncbi:MAG: hypothetical protein KF845_00780 [Cyclobacteriaceae bacterium]|nr:hypothetical protein [Cyclobacteriaceae bacterium]
MKPLSKSLFVLALLAASAAQAAPLEEAVDVMPSKYKNLFVFKAEKKLRGASVEVYYSNGDLVTTHQLEKRKMIIDFCDVKFGEYTIRIKKGNEVQEFHYVKK